jgi:hypothetical protein
MLQPESSTYFDPLDLLRRFVPTPLSATYRVGEFHVMVQTNDITLIPLALFGSDLRASNGWDWEWKLIREPDVPEPLESPIFLTSEALTVVAMGTACLIGVDYERRELLAFIGAGVDATAHQNSLVPFFCQLLRGRASAEPHPQTRRREELANG